MADGLGGVFLSLRSLFSVNCDRSRVSVTAEAWRGGAQGCRGAGLNYQAAHRGFAGGTGCREPRECDTWSWLCEIFQGGVMSHS